MKTPLEETKSNKNLSHKEGPEYVPLSDSLLRSLGLKNDFHNSTIDPRAIKAWELREELITACSLMSDQELLSELEKIRKNLREYSRKHIKENLREGAGRRMISGGIGEFENIFEILEKIDVIEETLDAKGVKYEKDDNIF
jgi:hypothetical protein